MLDQGTSAITLFSQVTRFGGVGDMSCMVLELDLMDVCQQAYST